MIRQPEVSRRIPVRSLPSARTEAAGTIELVEATPAECAALARRLDVPAVEALTCRYRLSGVDASGVVPADGLLQAQVIRVCVTTLDEFPTAVTEPFSIRFVPTERHDGAPDDALDLEADDEVPYVNGIIDLGEAAAQQLALALDPYPRKPGAERPAWVRLGDPPARPEDAVGEDAPDGAGEGSSDRPNSFAALARFRRPDG